MLVFGNFWCGGWEGKNEKVIQPRPASPEWSRLKFTDVKDGHGEKEAGVVVPSTVRRWADHIYVSLPRWKVG